MKALVIGCNGLLGQNLIRTLPVADKWQAVGVGIEPVPALTQSLNDYRSVDVTKRPDLESAIQHFSPDLILNAAAITDVDFGEREQALCTLLNRDAVGWMAATGIPLVQISSDYVFDGEAGPYSEEDPVNPLSHYGKTKLESEALALAGSPRSLVLRTMTLWGKGRGAKTSFVEFVKTSLSAGKPVRIVTDQWGNPTLAEDLALAVWHLVQGGKSGIYHVAGSDWNSRFTWTEAIAAYYGLDAKLIQPCLTADLKQLARRPLKSGLKIDKLVRDTGFRPHGVIDQLKRVDELANTP
jgi:dTDP-4-dehydrorhamnose reductase